jgi:hypothetical protein
MAKRHRDIGIDGQLADQLREAESRLDDASARLPTPLTQRKRSLGRQASHQGPAVPTVRVFDPPPLGSSATATPDPGFRPPDRVPSLPPSGQLLEVSRVAFMPTVMPALRRVPAEQIAQEAGLSRCYCARIRAGGCVPHWRHWGVSGLPSSGRTSLTSESVRPELCFSESR